MAQPTTTRRLSSMLLGLVYLSQVATVAVLAFAPSASHHHRYHHDRQQQSPPSRTSGTASRSSLYAEDNNSAVNGQVVSGPPYSGPAAKPILDSVQFPYDMKRLSMSQLKQVRHRPFCPVLGSSTRTNTHTCTTNVDE